MKAIIKAMLNAMMKVDGRLFHFVISCIFLIGMTGCQTSSREELSEKSDGKGLSVEGGSKIAVPGNPRLLASENSEMEYVEICRDHQNDSGSPKDCRKFSRLILGTDHVAAGNWTKDGQTPPSEAAVREVFTEAVRLGINTFDTSPIYVEGVEGKLGRWIKDSEELIKNPNFYESPQSNPDKKLYVVSKGGFPFDLVWLNKLPQGSHSEAFLKALREAQILGQNPEASLRNVPSGTYASRLFGSQSEITGRVAEELGHSYHQLNKNIAIYLMHRDDNDYLDFKQIQREQTPVSTIMSALSDSSVRDKFWMLGWSNWTTVRVNESLKLASQRKELARPVLNSPYFSLFEMSGKSIHAGGIQVTHAEMMDPHFQEGIKFMPYSPLGGFSILDQESPRWDNARKLAKLRADKGDLYWKNVYASIFTPENEKRFRRAVNLTKKLNAQNSGESHTTYTVDQIVNAYALAHPRTDFLTVGPINVTQLRRTVETLKLSKKLTKADLEYLYRGP
jgi:aryl-alcohol dehydrogenase-like predicted oxidoreductase